MNFYPPGFTQWSVCRSIHDSSTAIFNQDAVAESGLTEAVTARDLQAVIMEDSIRKLRVLEGIFS